MKNELKDNKILTSEFWNRKYIFNGLPLPEDIKVGGQSILNGAVKINAFSDIGIAVWDKQHIFYQNECDECCTYAFSSQSEKLILNAQVKLYDDGLVWMDLMLVPQWNIKPDVNEFSIEIPLKREFCELLHFWNQKDSPRNSDFFPDDGLNLSFRPAVWTGTEKAGFGFYMENAKNVLLTDANKMFELIPNGDTLNFKVTLFNKRPADWSSSDYWGSALAPIGYSFGFQVTPIRKMVKPLGFERSMHACLAQVNESMIPEIHKLGVKYLIFHEDWTMIQNYGLPEDETSFAHFVAELHKYGIRSLAYFGYEYSTLAPGFLQNKDNWLVKMENGHFYGGWQRFPAQRDYVCCYRGGYSDVMLRRVERALDKYDLDGIYTDGTYMPFECANEAHGCGYRDENGVLHSGFPLLAQREHVKKLHDLVHAHNGIIDAHQSSCCIPMILGYADSYWDGEHIQSDLRSDLNGYFNMGTLRSEYTGVNWGIPSQFIVYSTPEQTFENISGLLLLNNVYGRPWGINDTRIASNIWKIIDDFNTEKTQFTPCWDKDCPVKTDSASVFASCWEHDDNALVIVFGINKKTENVNISYKSELLNITVSPLTPLFIKF